MSLTSSGQLYLEYAQKISREMDTMRRAIRQQSTGAEGTIRINAPFGFGRKYIADAISQFVREYPQIDCQLYLTDHPVNLIERSFDVCIRFGNLPDSTLHARKLVTHQRWLCAAPRYLKKQERPRILVNYLTITVCFCAKTMIPTVIGHLSKRMSITTLK